MKKILLLIIFSILFLTFGQNSFAETAPQLIVNHETKECVELILGNECMACSIPEGWEILGPVSENECPAGYAKVEYFPETAEGEDEEIELVEKTDVIDYVVFTIVLSSAVAGALAILWFLFRRKKKQ